MTKIFKQLARHWAVCLAVFALLFVQAYCDLSLPDYTSKIVDTGIQQGGIESPLPQTVRKSTLDALSLLMNEDDAQKLQSAYQYYLQDDGVLQLRSDLTADERTALEDSITTPDIVLYMAAAQAANAPAGQTGMGMTGLADLQASGADRNTDTETETVAPTAKDLDTVCGQFAAMSQMPGFSRDAIQQQLTGAIGQLPPRGKTLPVRGELSRQRQSGGTGGAKRRMRGCHGSMLFGKSVVQLLFLIGHRVSRQYRHSTGVPSNLWSMPS